ncbi:MAG: SH3 domain-containing protein [Gammaproteobacteria bacterium]|nr:SH3 domain-containing protein [Gammaproteobacteria bacterium]
MKRLALLVGVALLSGQAYAEEYLYILSAKASIKSEPTFSSQTIESATKGEKLVTTDKNNRWFKVRYHDKEGWISRLSVSPNPPGRAARRLALNDENLQDNARLRASSVSTTAAVRGLQGDERNRLGQYETATDFQALATVEKMSISSDKLVSFLDERPFK